MKILALVGSLRKDSYNRVIYEHYRKIISAEAELIEGDYKDFPFYDEDIRAEEIPDSVIRLGAQIKKADGLMFFSPEYNYSVPGALKNAIDWLSRCPEQPFARKPTAIVSASPGKLGGARMQYQLRQIGVFLDLNIMNKPEVMIGEVKSKISIEGDLTDEATRAFLEKHYHQFKAFIQNG